MQVSVKIRKLYKQIDGEGEGEIGVGDKGEVMAVMGMFCYTSFFTSSSPTLYTIPPPISLSRVAYSYSLLTVTKRYTEFVA